MTTASSARTTGPSIFWRLVASSWLLLLLVPAGGLAWLAFGVLALVARRRAWGIVAAVYGVAAIVVQLPADPVGHILQGTLFLVVVLHGLILNQAWLLLLWGRRESGLTVFGNPAGGRPRAAARSRPRSQARVQAAAIPKEAEQLLGAGGTSRSDYLDDSAAAAPAPRRRATRAPAAPAALVDVNTANQRTLAKLTGMDRALAKAAVTERTKRGGFASLDDFAATAGLQPHEMVRLGSEAFCSSRPRTKRSFGRRVDY
ncbi:helix-hairpin-helix domain-containing protein [Cryobacterium sp. SO2]|uniref:ComEA family DNA-binding protein n=1 Tax=Cryobacterium sp. SO2 TaxID=1897060 RepID=UPI00223D4268|nr:helix-hairpin-helix domain-containing protein [Cryobacterium sp. SO2]WEO77196.1 helix-hairpin-helix domain-containing protein [Cryobacterium sp. SO2]